MFRVEELSLFVVKKNMWVAEAFQDGVVVFAVWPARGACDGFKRLGLPSLILTNAADPSGTGHVPIRQPNETFV